MVRTIKDKTLGNYLRLRVLLAYYRRDFQSFDQYLTKIQKLDPAFASFSRLFQRQFLKADVTVQEWKDWISQAGSVHPYILGRGYMELVTKFLHEEKALDAMEQFKNKCGRFGITASEANACIGILKLLLKQDKINQAKEFRVYVSGQIKGKKFEESFRLKLTEVSYEMDHVPEPRWKRAFEEFENTKLYRSKRDYFQELKETYLTIERQHPSLMDIRTSAEQQQKLKDLILEKITAKKPFQAIRLGDGESYGMNPGRVNRLIFDYDRTSREMKWWGQHLTVKQREKVIAQFQASLFQSDVIGIPGIFRFFRDFFKQTPTSRLGFSLISETTQRGLMIIMDEVSRHLREGKYPKDCWFAEHRFHQVIFKREDVVTFGAKSDRVLIVSKYDNDAIKRAFPEMVVDTVQIPDERTRGDSLPNRIDDISQKIHAKCGPGTMVWVAAGFAGKHFLKVAKDNGAVALDAGAMADYWMGRKTRQVADIV